MCVYFRFLPDRFTQKQNTAYMPFGIGNRACIGQRLAQLEMKMTLILTLKRFIVCTCEDTPVSVSEPALLAHDNKHGII